MALTPELLVSEWTSSRVIQWIQSLGIFDQKKVKQQFKNLTGLTLLALDESTVNKYISHFTKQQKQQFLSQLLTLKKFDIKLQQSVITFNHIKENIIKSLTFISTQHNIASNCDNLGSDLFNMHKVIEYISTKEIKQFECIISSLMTNVLPIITRSFKDNDLRTHGRHILFFMGNLTSYHNIIPVSYDNWIKSGFINELVNKLQDNRQYLASKRDVLHCIANMASNATRDKSLKRVFDKIDITAIIYEYIIKNVLDMKRNKDNKYELIKNMNRAQLLFPFRIILFLNDSKNDKCEWIIHNTYALEWFLNEYDFGLKCKGISQGTMIFYPDAWDRAISVNKLYDNNNHKLKTLLLNEDRYNIMQYLGRSLVFTEKTLYETRILYNNVCECLYKISMDNKNMNLLYKYQFMYFAHMNKPSSTSQSGNVENVDLMNVDFWCRLNWIVEHQTEFQKAAKYVIMLQRNMQKYYIDIFDQYTLLTVFPDAIIMEIASWIW
eukprot:514560_1